MLLVVCASIFKLEAFRQIIVHLNRTKLPTTSQSILHHEVKFRTIESSLAIFYMCRQTFFFTGFDNRAFCLFPVFFRTDILLAVHLVAQGNLGFVILEVECAENDEDNIHYAQELVFHLVGTAEDVGIILGKSADTCQSMQLTTLFVTINRTELSQTQRKVFV